MKKRNERPLTNHEADNLARLHEAGLPSASIFLTHTGLDKKYFDATEAVRDFLKKQGLHDYTQQRQGKGFIVRHEAIIFSKGKTIETKLSYNRPKSGDGDPRIWPSGLHNHASSDEVWIITIKDRTPIFLSLSHSYLAHELDLGVYGSDESRWIAPLIREANQVAQELIGKLRAIAVAGPIKAVCSGTTAVGRTVESALGIKMNSSPNPDYRGIELKSGSSSLVSAESRAQLFSKVPDWSLSKLQSISELLKNCGYKRDGGMHLRCTVSSLRENTQGLLLRVTDQLLEEISRKHRGSVVVWKMATLEESLKKKHRETFWIKARTLVIGTNKYFELLSATHTRNPVDGQLARLLDTGNIAVDHMISGDADGNRAHEKGPSFKLDRQRLAELFRSAPREYDLRDS